MNASAIVSCKAFGIAGGTQFTQHSSSFSLKGSDWAETLHPPHFQEIVIIFDS
jgi:hypothetical protein